MILENSHSFKKFKNQPFQKFTTRVRNFLQQFLCAICYCQKFLTLCYSQFLNFLKLWLFFQNTQFKIAIYLTEYHQCKHNFFFDEFVNTRLINILFETIGFDEYIKPYVPRPRCLLKPINRLKQLTNLLLLVFIHKPIWFRHINLIFKIAIQKYSLDIHLSNLVFKTDNYGEESADQFKHDNMIKDFFIVNPFVLYRHLSSSCRSICTQLFQVGL